MNNFAEHTMLDQKLKRVSVCIPARNEAKNIESLLRLVLTVLDDDSEVIVGINGCTDNTERIVEGLARSETRLSIVRSAPGKAYAVNALMKASQNDILLFLDADVSFEKDTPIALVDFLKSTSYVAACPDMQRTIESSNTLFSKIKKLWYMPLRVSTEMGLTGAMYTLKKGEFIEALKEKGYSDIPPVINEDHFTHLILEDRARGEKKWSNVPQAVVLFRPPGILDSYKRAKRIAKGDLQLVYEHQSLGLRMNESKEIPPTGKPETTEERRRRRIQMFRELSFDEKLLLILMIPVKRIVISFVEKLAEHNAIKEYRNKKDMIGWTPTKSDR